MSKIEIHIDGVDHVYTGPNGWEDISRKQLLSWCGILRQELTRDEALLIAAYLFYGIPKNVYSLLPEVLDINIVWRMEWLLENKLTRNVIETFRVGWTKYYGPAHRLSNLTIGEFRYTELYYDMYLRSGQNKYLYLLCAVLFRPRGGDVSDDMRKPIVEREIMKRAKLFSWAVHPKIIKAIQLQYEGSRAFVQRTFRRVYPEPSPNAGPLLPSRSDFNDLQEHILAYAGGKLGNFKETNVTNLYVFMKLLSQRIEEYQNRKK